MDILGLARNLLSVSMLNDVGVQVVFSKDGCKMMRGAMVLAKGTRRGTLFQLDACMSQCNSSSILACVPKGANTLEGKLPAEKTMLWHLRFGHIGEKGLRTLKKRSSLRG